MKEQSHTESIPENIKNDDQENCDQKAKTESKSDHIHDEKISSVKEKKSHDIEDPISIDVGDAGKVKMSLEDIKFDFFSKNDSSKKEANDDYMEELVQDMRHLIEGFNTIVKRFDQFEEKIQHSEQIAEKFLKGIAREVDQIRDQLLSERKAFVNRSVFTTILPAIESLEISQKNIDDKKDSIAYQQIKGVLDLLKTILQTIGYTPFSIEPGEEFNTSCMECAGYAEGEQGIVIKMERPGYKIGETVAKPCSVIVGQKSKNN